MTEAKIQSKILRYLNSEDECWAFKAESVTRGVPDVVCCYKGVFVTFEVKRSKSAKPSEIQKATLGKINAAGGHGVVVWTLEQVKQTLDGIDKQKGL